MVVYINYVLPKQSKHNRWNLSRFLAVECYKDSLINVFLVVNFEFLTITTHLW